MLDHCFLENVTCHTAKKTIDFRFKIFCSPPRYDIYGNKLSQPAIPVVWAQKDKPAFCQYFTYTTTTEIKDHFKILFCWLPKISL